LLTAVTFFQNAPFFTNKILFLKNLILKIKYIKIKKKKKKKKRGGRTTPMGVAGTPWAMGVVRPPPDRPIWGWPNHPHGLRGWPSHPFKSMKKKRKKKKRGGRTTP
jgi:hypothetical protein